MDTCGMRHAEDQACYGCTDPPVELMQFVENDQDRFDYEVMSEKRMFDEQAAAA